MMDSESSGNPVIGAAGLLKSLKLGQFNGISLVLSFKDLTITQEGEIINTDESSHSCYFIVLYISVVSDLLSGRDKILGPYP